MIVVAIAFAPQYLGRSQPRPTLLTCYSSLSLPAVERSPKCIIQSVLFILQGEPENFRDGWLTQVVDASSGVQLNLSNSTALMERWLPGSIRPLR